MKKILILDEYPSIRELLAEELSAEGYLVMPTGNPGLTEKLLLEFNPDLVIMDIFIHGKLQGELVEGIKKEKPALPVLIFTAECPPGDDHLPCGIRFVNKSPILDELKKRIQEMTGLWVQGKDV
jgi:DNA-binding response OmpR family regulator